MLNLRIKTKELIDFSRIKQAPIEVNSYIHGHMNSILVKAESRIREYIYSKLHQKTGSLGRALRTTNAKTTQYGTRVGFYIDSSVAPHASTVIGKGSLTINAKDKLLTVPNIHGTKYKRVTPGMTFNKKAGRYGAWYTGSGKNKHYEFFGEKSVTIRNRVNPDVIEDMFTFDVQYGVEKLAQKAIANFIRK